MTKTGKLRMPLDPDDQAMLEQCTRIVKEVKFGMRYRGSYGTGDILASLVARWIKSGHYDKLKALPAEERNIKLSVRNFILDRLGIDRVIIAANKRVAKQHPPEAHLLQIIDEDKFRVWLSTGHLVVVTDESSPPPCLRGAQVMLHHIDARERRALEQTIEQRGNVVVRPSKDVKFSDLLASVDYLVVGPDPATRVELPDDDKLADLVRREEMSVWMEKQIKRLKAGQVDERALTAKTQLVQRHPVEVGTALERTIQGYTREEISEHYLEVVASGVQARIEAGERYLAKLRLVEETQL